MDELSALWTLEITLRPQQLKYNILCMNYHRQQPIVSALMCTWSSHFRPPAVGA
jgi:hypothetical protein